MLLLSLRRLFRCHYADASPLLLHYYALLTPFAESRRHAAIIIHDYARYYATLPPFSCDSMPTPYAADIFRALSPYAAIFTPADATHYSTPMLITL